MRSAWIFGYGSLVWRPAFPFRRRRPAFVRGWARRFWQGSTDHRGVPGAPGRVVTLVPEAATCWGAGYEIDSAEAGHILDLLDLREQGGYERHDVVLHFSDNGPEDDCNRGLVYVATPANRNYLGPAPLDEIAAQVRGSSGPSGHNVEYVLQLARALRDMNARDDHVFALERLLLEQP